MKIWTMLFFCIILNNKYTCIPPYILAGVVLLCPSPGNLTMFFFQYIYTSTSQTFKKNNLKRRQPSCMFVLNLGQSHPQGFFFWGGGGSPLQNVASPPPKKKWKDISEGENYIGKKLNGLLAKHNAEVSCRHTIRG